MSDSPLITVNFLGASSVVFTENEHTETPVFYNKKTHALLLYLLSQPTQTFSRSQLAKLFWPNSNDKNSLQCLRQTLSNLRKTHPSFDSVFICTNKEISIQQAHVFSDLRITQNPDSSSSINEIERSIELYKGTFLEDFDPGLDEFSAWKTKKKEYYAQQHRQNLKQLTNQYILNGDTGLAITSYLRLIKLNPLDEQVYTELLQLLYQRGDYEFAIQHYKHYSDTLKKENKQPAEELNSIYTKIKTKIESTYHEKLPTLSSIERNNLAIYYNIDFNSDYPYKEQITNLFIQHIIKSTNNESQYKILETNNKSLFLNISEIRTYDFTFMFCIEKIRNTLKYYIKDNDKIKSIQIIIGNLDNKIQENAPLSLLNGSGVYISDTLFNKLNTSNKNIGKIFNCNNKITNIGSIIKYEPLVSEKYNYNLYKSKTLIKFNNELKTCIETNQGFNSHYHSELGIGKTTLLKYIADYTETLGCYSFYTSANTQINAYHTYLKQLLATILNITINSEEDISKNTELNTLHSDSIKSDVYLSIAYHVLDISPPRNYGTIFSSLSDYSKITHTYNLFRLLLLRKTKNEPVVLCIDDIDSCTSIINFSLRLLRDLSYKPFILISSSTETQSIQKLIDTSKQNLHELSSSALNNNLDISKKNTPLHQKWLAQQQFYSGALFNEKSSVEDLIFSQFTTLNEEEQVILQACSCLGDEFYTTDLSQIVAKKDINLNNIIAHGFIESNKEQIKFTHQIVQKTIYTTTPYDIRTEWHKKAAANYLYKDNILHAQHLLQIKSNNCSTALLTTAIEKADESYFGTALELADILIQLDIPTTDALNKQKYSASLLKSDIYLKIGKPVFAIQAFNNAKLYAVTETQNSEIDLGIAMALLQHSQYSQAENILNTCRPILLKDKNLITQIKLYFTQAEIQFKQDKIGQAIAAYTIALEFSINACNDQWRVCLLSKLAQCNFNRSHLLSAHSLADESLHISHQKPLGQYISENLSLRAKTWLYQNEFILSEHDAENALIYSTLDNNNETRTDAIICLARVSLLKGQWRKTLKYMNQAILSSTKVDNDSLHYDIVCLMALAYDRLEQTPRAIKLIEQLISHNKTQKIEYQSIPLAVLALLHTEAQDSDQCLAQLNLLSDSKINTRLALMTNFFAAEACLKRHLWEEAQSFADNIVLLTKHEPIPFFILIVERVRIISNAYQIPDAPDTRVELVDLYRQTKTMGLEFFLPAFEHALKETTTSQTTR